MKELFHLARRFFASLRPGAPSSSDLDWVHAVLEADSAPAVRALWERMSNPDKRHAVGVARKVGAQLGPGTENDVLLAALMHDVGKVACNYRTPARSVATVVWALMPDAKADGWIGGRAPLHRLGQYRRHPQIGEDLLREAGVAELVSSWAADHHKPESAWRVHRDVGAVLKACDDD